MPAGAGLAERGHEVAGGAAGGHGDGDVARPGAGDELAGEHEVEADVVAERGEDRLVGGERPGRERLADRRAARTARRAVATSVELPPLPNANIRPPAANRRAISAAAVAISSRLASSVDSRSARALGGLGGGRGGEVAQQGVLVALLGVEEGVEEVGRSPSRHLVDSSRPIAVPAWTSRRSPGAPGRSAASRRPRRRTPCAPGRGPTTSPSRPSSEQVMQTSSVHSALGAAGRGARSRRG